MGARYPDQVGGHKPSVPVVGFGTLLSSYGTVLTGSIVVPLASASNEGRLWVRATLIR